VKLTATILLYAQITTSVTLSAKHQKQLSQIKSPEKKAKMLKLFLKRDSTQQAKAARKQALKQAKKLAKNIKLNDKSRGFGTKKVKEGIETAGVLTDTANMKRNGLRTLSTEANKHFGNTKEMKEVNKVKGEVEDYTGDVTEIKETVSDLKDTKKLGDKLEQEVIQHTDLSEVQQQQKELEELRDTPAKYQKEMEQIKDPGKLRAEMIRKAKANATEFVLKHSQALSQAQNKLAKLKRKYISVPNANDLSTATKRNSLKGKPLKDRLYLTGNFQILSTEPFSLDGSLSLGYKFNKKFLMGVNGVYRQTFGHYNVLYPHAPEDAAGFGGFTSMQVKRGFFGYGEIERMNAEVKDRLTDQTHRIWTTGIHAGIGRTMNFNKLLKTQVLFLYNFTHKQNQQLYPGRFIVKVGFQLNRERMKLSR